MSLSPEARARMQEVARTLLAPLEEWIARPGITDIWLYRGRLVYQDAGEYPTVAEPVAWLTDKWLGDTTFVIICSPTEITTPNIHTAASVIEV